MHASVVSQIFGDSRDSTRHMSSPDPSPARHQHFSAPIRERHVSAHQLLIQ
ncbi:hypothetical protein Sjap_025682 [Stephania japonica]|uniref:Uncharacterized protein n=1 Tax=Stephania japonica TaxID=461633 RepID=A0AAP0E277_9MAGN